MEEELIEDEERQSGERDLWQCGQADPSTRASWQIVKGTSLHSQRPDLDNILILLLGLKRDSIPLSPCNSNPNHPR